MTPDDVIAWAGYATTSPLYTELCRVVAGNPELMDILNSIEHTPQPNILFAGVQYLMGRDGGGALEAHYPKFQPGARVAGVVGPFTEFVLAHRDELVEIGRTRYTQTNEPRRCVALLPVIWMAGFERFHLVDVGTSAGLNLLLDRYHYRWDGIEWGPDSPVRLETELRSGAVVPEPIQILSRTGIDLNPIDPSNPDERAWLEALVWPEHHDRRARLRAALEIGGGSDVELVAGDALEELGEVIRGLPTGEPVVVMHSLVLNQFTPEQRTRFTATLDELRRDREIADVGMEIMDTDDPWSVLTLDSGSGSLTVGQAHHHGEWLEL